MTVDELRVHLNNLINKYVLDEPARQRLLELVGRDDVPAKGILVELTPFTSGRMSEEDRRLIGEIAFYYC